MQIFINQNIPLYFPKASFGEDGNLLSNFYNTFTDRTNQFAANKWTPLYPRF